MSDRDGQTAGAHMRHGQQMTGPVPVHRIEMVSTSPGPTPLVAIARSARTGSRASVMRQDSVAPPMDQATAEHKTMSCAMMGDWPKVKGLIKRLPLINYTYYAFWIGPTFEGAEALVNTFILVSSLMLTIAISIPLSIELGELDIADERFRGIGYRHNRSGKPVLGVPIGRYGCATRGVDQISILLLERFWWSVCLLGTSVVISMVMVVSLNTLKKSKFYNTTTTRGSVDCLVGDTVDGGQDYTDEENVTGKLRVTGGRKRAAGRTAAKDRAIAKVFEDWWWFMWFPMYGNFIILLASVCTFIQTSWTLVTIKFPHPFIQKTCEEYGWVPIPPTDTQIELGTEQYINGTFLSHNQILFGFDGRNGRVDYHLVNAGLFAVPCMLLTTILLGYAARWIDMANKKIDKKAKHIETKHLENESFTGLVDGPASKQSQALGDYLASAGCEDLVPLFNEQGITVGDIQAADDQYLSTVLLEIGIRAGDRMKLVKAKHSFPRDPLAVNKYNY